MVSFGTDVENYVRHNPAILPILARFFRMEIAAD